MKAFRPIVIVCAAVVLVGCSFTQNDGFRRLGAVRTLFDEGRIVSNFSSMGSLFEVAQIDTTRKAQPFAKGTPLSLNANFDRWREARDVTSIHVLKLGKTIYEDSYLGTSPNDLRIQWSVSKSYLSVLIGILIEQGTITSVEDLAAKYAPELVGTPYEFVSIRDLLQMSSGVAFDENYGLYFSDINKMGRVLALGGSMDDFALKDRPRHAQPGVRWRYISIDTHVLGLVARRATGQSLPDLMAQHILNPLGVDRQPYYLTDSQGVAFALGGMNLTTRDMARFGEMVRNNGQFQGHRIAPEAWIDLSTRPSALTAPGALQYGYHWWMPADARPGEFYADGVYGQFIYVDRASGIVIALTGADRGFSNPGVTDEYIAGFREIVRKSK